MAEPYFVLKILATWSQQITRFSVTIANLETINDMQSWFWTEQLNGSRHIRAKQKNHKKTQKRLQKFTGLDRNPKVIYTDNSLEFGIACEDFSWNHCTSTRHFSATYGVAQRAVRKVKKRHLCCIVTIGSKWKLVAESMECYTYLRKVTDLLSDGKTPYERRFGHPLKNKLFHLVHWLSITL